MIVLQSDYVGSGDINGGRTSAKLEITVAHRTLSNQISRMSGQFHIIIGHNDQIISSAHLELSSSRYCQSINYVQFNV